MLEVLRIPPPVIRPTTSKLPAISARPVRLMLVPDRLPLRLVTPATWKLSTASAAPILTLPLIPAPPVTTNAPVVVLVL